MHLLRWRCACSADFGLPSSTWTRAVPATAPRRVPHSRVKLHLPNPVTYPGIRLDVIAWKWATASWATLFRLPSRCLVILLVLVRTYVRTRRGILKRRHRTPRVYRILICVCVCVHIYVYLCMYASMYAWPRRMYLSARLRRDWIKSTPSGII